MPVGRYNSPCPICGKNMKGHAILPVSKGGFKEDRRWAHARCVNRKQQENKK